MLYLHGADMNCCCCCCWTTKRTCLVYVVPLCSMLCLCALRDANATAKREAHSTPPSTICMRILFFGHVPYLLVKRKLDHSNSRAIKDISKSLFNLRSRSIFFFCYSLLCPSTLCRVHRDRSSCGTTVRRFMFGATKSVAEQCAKRNWFLFFFSTIRWPINIFRYRWKRNFPGGMILINQTVVRCKCGRTVSATKTPCCQCSKRRQQSHYSSGHLNNTQSLQSGALARPPCRGQPTNRTEQKKWMRMGRIAFRTRLVISHSFRTRRHCRPSRRRTKISNLR